MPAEKYVPTRNYILYKTFPFVSKVPFGARDVSSGLINSVNYNNSIISETI